MEQQQKFREISSSIRKKQLVYWIEYIPDLIFCFSPIDFPEIPMAFNTQKTFFEDILQYFQYEAFSAIVKEWNNLRKECLEFAFYKLLYPMLKTELRNKLTREAKDGVITACRFV